MKHLLVASMCVVAGASATAGRAAPGATLDVALGEYFSTVYTAGPQAHAEYVWWRTEPLVLRVSLTNEGREPIVLRRPPGSGSPFAVSIAPVETRSPQVARVTWFSLVTLSPSLSERPATLPAALESSSSLRWTGVTSDVSSLRPGTYRFMVRSELNLGGASLQVNNDSVRVDLRDVATDTDRLELLRIRATRCLRE